MKFDEARFRKIISALGLSLPQSSGKNVRLYQGGADTVVFGGDVLCVDGAEIREVKLVSGLPKLSFQELESIISLSERIKTAGFPPLELELTVQQRVTGVNGKILEHDHPVAVPSEELVGLPASPGIIKAPCLVLPFGEELSGKIIVLENSKDLFSLMSKKPSGIILEEGNLLSHASILAREARIPAIVKVQGATKKLRSHEIIELDATSGTIRRS